MKNHKAWLNRLAQVYEDDLRRVVKAVKGNGVVSENAGSIPFLLYAREIIELLRGKNRYVKCLEVKDDHTICALPTSEVKCEGCMFYRTRSNGKTPVCEFSNSI